MKRYLNGWPLVGWFSLVVAFLVLAVLTKLGFNKEGFQGVLHLTGKTSLLLFTSAFIASSLFKTWPTPWSRWIARNRRYLGVSFACSHFFHLVSILVLIRISPDFMNSLRLSAIVGGSIGYFFIAAMTATSFDRTTEWLGARRWKILHTTGVYYLWFIFFVTYTFYIFSKSPVYVFFTLFLLGSLTLRLKVLFQKRKMAPSIPTTQE
jgi:sulfoxide reductase heme-binding subunit YedZ